jgi:pimeloyl-ACP methyl ester carboxylesterase
MTTTDLNAPPLEFIDLAGYRMAYRQWGNTDQTEAIVLIHGITSSSLSWIRVAPHLADQARVIAVDLKGHGDSDRPTSGYRLADQAGEIAQLVQALGVGNVRVMGHSWGGGIAITLAAANVLPISRMVLEDPAIAVGGGSPERRQQTVQNYIASVGLGRDEAEQRVRSTAAPGWTEEDIQGKIDASVKTSRSAVQSVFEENGAWEVTDQLARVRVPTLLVRAEVERGGIVGEATLAALRANPSIQVVTIPNADHNIHRGEFDAFMSCIEPFIRAGW